MKPIPLCTGILLPSAPASKSWSQTSRYILHRHSFFHRGPLSKSWGNGHNYCSERFKYILQRNFLLQTQGTTQTVTNPMCTFTTVCKTIHFLSGLKQMLKHTASRKGERRAAYWFCIRATSEKKGKNIIVETNVAPPHPPFRKHKGFKYMKQAQLCSYPLKGHQLPKLGCVAERNKNETGSNQLWN